MIMGQESYSHQLKNGNFVTPVRLNEKEEIDITNMLTKLEGVKDGFNSFHGHAFSKPPEVKMPKLGLKAGKHMQNLLDGKGETWRREAHIRLNGYGLVPYMFKVVGDSYYPTIPPLGTGHIKTYYDTDELEQKYLWFWNNQSDPKPAMGIEWIVESPPTVSGHHTSIAMSVLESWKDRTLTIQNSQRVDHQISHGPLFLEKNPPKNKPGDDQLTAMSFGDVEEGFVDNEIQERDARRQVMDMGALDRALLHAHSKNTGETFSSASKPPLWSEDEIDRQKREGNTWYSRSVALPEYWKVTQTTAPRGCRDPLPISQRLDQLVGGLVDFPVQVLTSRSGKTHDNSAIILKIANNRTRDILTRWKGYYKKMLLQCYGRNFKAQQKNIRKRVFLARRKPMSDLELLELQDIFEITVEMPFTPLTTPEQVEKLWTSGVINQETYAKRVIELTDMREEDMDITKLDLIYPGTIQELKMKKKYAAKANQSGVKKQDNESGASKRKNTDDSSNETPTKIIKTVK